MSTQVLDFQNLLRRRPGQGIIDARTMMDQGQGIPTVAPPPVYGPPAPPTSTSDGNAQPTVSAPGEPQSSGGASDGSSNPVGGVPYQHRASDAYNDYLGSHQPVAPPDYKGMGRVGKIFGVLSDIFLKQNIPQQMNQYENARRYQDWSAREGEREKQLGILKAAADEERQAQNTQSELDYRRAEVARAHAQTDYFSRRNPNDKLDDLIGQAAAAGNDPEVQRLQDIKRAGITPKEPDNPFAVYHRQHMDEPNVVDHYFDTQNRSRADYRTPPREPRGTPAQFAAAEAKKGKALRDLERQFREGSVSRGDLSQKKQDVQDDYENQIRALGGSPEPFTYPAVSPPSEHTTSWRNRIYDFFSPRGVDPSEPNLNPPDQAEPIVHPPGQSAPAKGSTKMYRGHAYLFDGQQWVLQSNK